MHDTFNNIDLILEEKFRKDDNSEYALDYLEDDEWEEMECLYGYFVNR